jgi:GNAT superfamily N-acetyltransferase
MAEIVQVSYQEWRRFQPYLEGGPCCNPAFPQGVCYALLLDGDTESMAAMVWYTFAYRHSPWRRAAITELAEMTLQETVDFLNKNVRLLARVSTLPQYRKHGFARRLVSETIGRLEAKYVECLTAWPDVRRLLARTGFTLKSEHNGIDYWLWERSLSPATLAGFTPGSER